VTFGQRREKNGDRSIPAPLTIDDHDRPRAPRRQRGATRCSRDRSTVPKLRPDQVFAAVPTSTTLLEVK
jgi:hypothetical protein